MTEVYPFRPTFNIALSKVRPILGTRERGLAEKEESQ